MNTHPYVYNAEASACHLFPVCDNAIEGTVTNPFMGEIPSCERCAQVTGQTLNPIPSGAKTMIRFTTEHEIPAPVTEIPKGAEITFFLATGDDVELSK
ncbi:hypothetical protein [Lentzea kentuckyensis]|uniref:hypothetical protein n=1 Tax=Lentzea kentuckyensis TaxID=360086 RepID=UPI000A37EC22|nr:hypothetical protein [Lentzea kentuckyensis]